MAPEPKTTAVKALRVAAGDDRTRYDDFALWLHWLTVVLVLTQFVLSQTWGYAPKPTRHLMIVAHMSFGIALAAVIVVRLAWRLTPGHRVRPASSGPTEWLAAGVHWLLYAMIVAEAVLGFLLRWSGNESMSFFGLQIPPPFEPWSKPANHLVGELHEWTGWAIIVVASVHALAALFHHFVLKDNVLWRILPGERARRMSERAPAPERVVGVSRD
jgi:cytochrome b561